MVLSLIAAVVLSASPRVVLSGQVVGPDGGPTAGARVSGTLEWNTGSSTFNVEATDGGTFALSLVPATAKLQVIRVQAWAPGFSTADEQRAQPEGTVLLRLRPLVRFTVNVIDDLSLAAIPEATVRLASGELRQVDPAGIATFDGLNDRSRVDVVISAPGYLEVRWPSVSAGQPLTVRLQKGGALRVRVLDLATGRPVAQCALKTLFGDVATDAAGSFEVRAAYGRLQLWSACPGYGPDYDGAPQGHLIDVKEGQTARIHTLRLRPSQRLTVRVLDARGAPASGLHVSRTHISARPPSFAEMRHGPSYEAAVTDDRGEVSFDSSMDEFDLTVEGPEVIRQRLKTTGVRSPLVVRLK